jgi:hypothetical protein
MKINIRTNRRVKKALKIFYQKYGLWLMPDADSFQTLKTFIHISNVPLLNIQF